MKGSAAKHRISSNTGVGQNRFNCITFRMFLYNSLFAGKMSRFKLKYVSPQLGGRINQWPVKKESPVQNNLATLYPVDARAVSSNDSPIDVLTEWSIVLLHVSGV